MDSSRTRGGYGESSFRGQRNLLAALLGEAVDSYRKTCGSTHPAQRRLHDETEEWIFSEDRSWSLSFLSVCDALGIDPSQLRRLLRAWKTSRRLPGGRRA